MSKLSYIFLFIFVPSILIGQFTHSFFAGPSITKNRLLLHGVDDHVFINLDGPTYKVFYNLGYRLQYRLNSQFSLNSEIQFKKIGSDRVQRYIISNTYQDSWQNYISLPIIISHHTLKKHSFGLGWVFNYRLDEAQDNFLNAAFFKIDRKYKFCHDLAVEYIINLESNFNIKIRWEEGFDSVTDFDIFQFKNRGFHFSLMYSIQK